MINKRELGAAYEEKAAAYLETQGYEILERNYQCKMGEVDIIAKDGEYLVFLEVKYRKSIKNGHPLEAVSTTKQKKICKTALYYMMLKGWTHLPVRFDVIGILGEEITLMKNAFDYVY